MLSSSDISAIKSVINAVDVIEAGTYLCGHPKINDSTDVCIAVTPDSFAIFKGRDQLGAIPKSAVKQISIEDKTTIEQKVTAARVLALGVFAFAFKKKTANEMGFVVVEWTDERNLAHNTTFKIEGDGSLAAANTLRNKLINNL